MNPSSMALLPPQTINKNTASPSENVNVHHCAGSNLMVGVSLAQPGPTTGILPPTATGHAIGPLGDCINMQGVPISGGGIIPAPQGQPPTTTPCAGGGGGTAPNSTAPSAGGSVIIQSTPTMANMKEKTPMCLINELARFNKVQHQYRLVDESGPPHKKTFTVVLKLDSEEYTASGPSIKKAQHAAAAIALEQTSLKHPPPKTLRKTMGPITPTVELNALAMKRGEPAVYNLIEPQRPQYIPNLNFRGMYNQRYHFPKTPIYYVSLKVGNRQYFGEGRTAQAARHAAAEEALTVLRNLPFPDNVKKHQPEGLPSGPPSNGEVLHDDDDDDDDLKSPISLVHEIALKRGLAVNFEVVKESGPPHMRTFITRCSVSDIVTEGEGNGKKVSKKRAAEQMLEELKKLPPLPPAQQKVKKKPIIKKKNRNLIKCSTSCLSPFPQEQKADPQYGQGINPISRLIQIQQAKKEREPVYTVIDERGEPRQREFIMQCSLGDVSTTGSGPNKKTAKRNAAESMLQLMGYSRPIVPQGKNPIKNAGIEAPLMYPNQDAEKNRKATFTEQDVEKLDNEGKLGRQLVPGLLLMPDATGLSSDQNSVQNYPLGNSALNRAPGGPINVSKITMQTTSAIAKELLDTGVSPTADAIRKSGPKQVMPHSTSPVQPKQQLSYLADVLGFQVHFTDFPKGNKQEHLSLVSLSTHPPLVKHGAGPTIEASHDQAALMALKTLAELGLEAVTEGGKKEQNSANLGAGDGMYIAGSQSAAPKLTNSSVTELGTNPKAGVNVVPIAAKDSH